MCILGTEPWSSISIRTVLHHHLSGHILKKKKWVLSLLRNIEANAPVLLLAWVQRHLREQRGSRLVLQNPV